MSIHSIDTVYRPPPPNGALPMETGRWNTLLTLRVLRFYGFGAKKGGEMP